MPRRKRDFRWIRWLLFLVLIVGAIVVAILIKNSFDNKTSNDKNQQATKVDNSEKKAEDNSGNETNTSSNNTVETPKQDEKVPQYDGGSPNKSEVLTGLITYADVVNNELVIRVNIDQFLQSGSCNLRITRDGVDYYSQSAGIVESVTTSTCDGFKISTSELPTGNLQVEINLESEGKSGKIESRVKI